MNAVTVENPSVRNHNSKCINEFAQERDPMLVLNVGRPSTTDQILINTKQLIPKANLKKAVILRKALPRNQHLVCIYVYINQSL